MLELADDMLAALGCDRSLPGAALRRRAAYQRLMVDWLADTIARARRLTPETARSRGR